MDVVLTIYKYCYQHVNRGTSYNEIVGLLSNKNIDATVQPYHEIVRQTLIKIYGHDSFEYYNADNPFPMQPEAYFQYLDLLELNQARKDSRSARKDALKAQKTANWALGIAIFVGLLQITIAVLAWQLPVVK